MVTKTGLKWEVAESIHFPGEWRVEATDVDADGECYVTIFAGPGAKERAEEYAVWVGTAPRN